MQWQLKPRICFLQSLKRKKGTKAQEIYCKLYYFPSLEKYTYVCTRKQCKQKIISISDPFKLSSVAIILKQN